MDYIDTYKPQSLQGHWESPPKLFQIPEDTPENLSNEQFVEFLYYNVLNEPEDAFGYEATKLVRDLNIGAQVEHGVIEPIDREKIFNKCKQQAMNKIVVEKIRSGMANMQPEKFIELAN